MSSIATIQNSEWQEETEDTIGTVYIYIDTQVNTFIYIAYVYAQCSCYCNWSATNKNNDFRYPCEKLHIQRT